MEEIKTNKDNVAQRLEELQYIMIDAILDELERGDTSNISTANTLLANNKVVIKQDDGDNIHNKIKKTIRRKKNEESTK